MYTQVFIGRPILWGLAHSGEAGVRNVIQILKKELDLVMALSGGLSYILKYDGGCLTNFLFLSTGCSSIEDVDRSLVIRHDFLSATF